MATTDEIQRWTRTIFFTIATIVTIVLLTRFSLWQRDEYWREKEGTLSTRNGFPRQTLNSLKQNMFCHQYSGCLNR